jgi:type IV secretion system protein VirB10
MNDQDAPSYKPPLFKRLGLNPEGVLPRNAQKLAIVTISLLMIVILVFSGRSGSKDTPMRQAQAVPVPDATQARIEEYRARIDEQARKLAAEQARLAQSRRGADDMSTWAASPPAGALSTYQAEGLAPPVYSDARSSAVTQQRDEIAAAWLRRDYESRFVSSLAIDRRQRTASVAPKADADANQKKPESGTTYTIPEGTVIETVLTNRLDGAFSGPVNCMVTSPVYSPDRRRVLIPAGSRVLGQVQKVDSFGQQRLAVTFHRILLPDGRDVSLEAFPGLNQVGETGLVDRVDRHYLQIFGVSMAIGAIAGLSQANTGYGADRSASDAYRQGVASSVSQTSLNILDRYLNVLPTFTVEAGHRLKVYITRDLALPALDPNRAANS